MDVSMSSGAVFLGAAIVGTGLLLLVGLRPAGGAPVGPRVPAGARLLLIGDSLSVGLRRRLEGSAGATGVTFQHLGKEGTRTDQWAGDGEWGQALQRTLQTFRPTVVMVSLGTNDEAPRKGQPALEILPRQRVALTRLLGRLRTDGARVLWIGPPGNAFMDPAYRRGIRALVGEASYFPSEGMAIPRAGDGLHPTGAAYVAWGDAIWAWATRRSS